MFSRKSKKAQPKPVMSKPTMPKQTRKVLPAKPTSSGNMRHESGLVLQKNDVMLRDYKISTPDGDGWLVISFERVYIVIKRKGVHLFLEHDQVTDLKTSGSNLTIHWSEKRVNLYDYTVKIAGGNSSVAEAVDVLDACGCFCDARYVHIPAEERETVRKSRIEAQRAKILAQEGEVAELRKKLDSLLNEFEPKDPDQDAIRKELSAQNIIPAHDFPTCSHVGGKPAGQAYSAYVKDAGQIMARMAEIERDMEPERANLYFAAFDTVQRSPLIPEHVENLDVWYNVYYDAKLDVYVVMQDRITSDVQSKKIRKIMDMPFGCGSTPYSAKRVMMIFGQPAIKSIHRMNRNWATAWLCVPNLGVENYHYMREKGIGFPQIHSNYHYQVRTNTHGHNGLDKESLRLAMRVGFLAAWLDPEQDPVVDEIMEEERQLAKEGNPNHTLLTLNDPQYADGEHISKTPHTVWKPDVFWFEDYLYHR